MLHLLRRGPEEVKDCKLCCQISPLRYRHAVHVFLMLKRLPTDLLHEMCKLYEVVHSFPLFFGEANSSLPLLPSDVCFRNVLRTFTYSPGNVVAGLIGGTEVRD